ncbi:MULTISPECIES: hypothetical protein [unclassified Agarivorans]|uniref:hypothetical protein n=1 Tax=unclassified Agarivorans TaxID=2636026 RepID=UPI003D7E0A7F
MKKSAFYCALLLLTVMSSSASATIINISGRTNASLAGSNALNVSLEPGDYQLSFVQDVYTAFNRFGSVRACDGLGENCVRGWENTVGYIIDDITYWYGESQGIAGLGPINPGDGYYSSAVYSLAKSSGLFANFHLDSVTNVGFYIPDSNIGDNIGGVSLELNSVPEPATWLTLILILVGLTLSHSRKKTNSSPEMAVIV